MKDMTDAGFARVQAYSADWHADANAERISFGPLAPPDPRLAGDLPTGVNRNKFSMRWTNRPTFQQAIEFSGHR
jgi:hypothetical protein